MERAIRSFYGWSALLLAVSLCGCASLDNDNSSSKPWNEPVRDGVNGDWMMKPVFEDPSWQQ